MDVRLGHETTSVRELLKITEYWSTILSQSGTLQKSACMVRLRWESNLSFSDYDANVLQQMVNVYSYQMLLSQLTKRRLRVHGMWFALHSGDIHLYSRLNKAFLPVNQETISMLTKEVNYQLARLPIEL
ncbi:unnamed protein product [Trichobilharzia regenti]|nr:unnamed protein product [Trichobilharzia regenti]